MNRSLSRRPCVEALEDRYCPAFFAGVVDGNLLISADEATSLSINGVDVNSFRVVEQNTGTDVTLNGVTGDLLFNLSPEDDSLLIQGAYIPANLSINAGKGHDLVQLSFFETLGGVFVNLDQGDDRLDIDAARITGDLQVFGGNEADIVTLGEIYYPFDVHVFGETLIDTGNQQDEVRVFNAVLYGDTTVDLGNASDVLVYLSSPLGLGATTLDGGNGVDAFVGITNDLLSIDGFESYSSGS